jgi:hypothetical protein
MALFFLLTAATTFLGADGAVTVTAVVLSNVVVCPSTKGSLATVGASSTRTDDDSITVVTLSDAASDS